MTKREEILTYLDSHKAALNRYGVKKIGVFGSAARGDYTEGSDIDLLVEFTRKTFDNYMDLKFYLEDSFHTKIDLVLADGIKPSLRGNILNEVRYAQGI